MALLVDQKPHWRGNMCLAIIGGDRSKTNRGVISGGDWSIFVKLRSQP